MCRYFAVVSVRRSAKTERVYEARGGQYKYDELARLTHAGQPMVIPNTASMVSPFPYPKALYLCVKKERSTLLCRNNEYDMGEMTYIAGAYRGKPKPAMERRHQTAAIAEKHIRVRKTVRPEEAGTHLMPHIERNCQSRTPVRCGLSGRFRN